MVAAQCTVVWSLLRVQCAVVWSLLSVLSRGRCSVDWCVAAVECSRSFPIFCVGDVTPVVWLFQSNGHKTHGLVRPFQGTSALKGRAWKQTVELFEKVRVHVGCRM